MSARQVAAVIVTYAYPVADLRQLVESIAAEVGRVVLIDNNPEPALMEPPVNGCTTVHNKANLGLARALNQGLDTAMGDGFEWILLLDQDSRPHSGMIEHLLTAWTTLRNDGSRVAAIGPVIQDSRTGLTLPFVRYRWYGLEKHWPAPRSPIAADMLITSGTLTHATAVRQVGGMDETLFIDNLDVDWCLRAKAQGLALFGIPGARLEHSLGERVQRIPLLGKQVFVHKPQRQYHIMRNHLRLLRRGYIPLVWKISHTVKMIYRLAFFSLFVTPRWHNFHMMALGIWHGITRH